MPDDETAEASGFAALGVRPETRACLTRLGYEEPTPIQRETFAPLVEGRDLLGQAATGTGKTAAFALPILERLDVGRTVSAPVALILTPTRELAVQVSEAIYRYGRELDAQVLPIYGGQPIVRQLKVLARGVDVVVATPGRARDHLQRGSLPLDAVQVVVLDEADEMLDMGFAEDIEAILQATPADHQTVLFSATMPPRLDGIVKRHLHDPLRIEMGRRSAEATDGSPLVRQVAYLVARAHKPAALGRVLDIEAPTAAIVFCRTRIEVDTVTETMNARGYRAEALHGGMTQEQRDRVMGRLRSGAADLLVATDVAARGLDVDHLTHVVNYDVPSAPEAYVHRIGRVGRAGREGVAITLAEPRERRLLANIERTTKRSIPLDPIPSVADLRARQIEATVRSLRESMEAEDLEDFRPVLDALGDPDDDLDLAEVALAALRLAHLATGVTVDDQEIPVVKLRKDRESAGPRPGGQPTRDRGDRGDRPNRAPSGAGGGSVFVGVGRSSGIRPGDLVGAIANETGLAGRDIGAIRIHEHHAIVEVPAAAVDEVIEALRATTIKGKKTTVRRDRFQPR